jgi:signal transduction histidine kinase
MDLSGHLAVRDLRRELEATRGRIAGMVEGQGLGGGRMMLSGAYIPAARWLVVAEEPYADVFRPVWMALARNAAILAAGLLAAIIASYFLARHLAQPILELRHGAERIAQGDLATRIEARTGDEVEALASQFNNMAGQLQEHTAGLERKVAERTSELEAAMRARSLFLAAASHDLRQPLYAISLLSDALAAEPLPGRAAAVLGKQRQAIGVLGALFDNLLDLSRFESGAVRSSPRNVSLRDILQPLCTEYEVLANSKKLEWQAEVPDVRIHTDPELFRRLAANLLSNAVRFSERVSVNLLVETHAGHVVFTVVDTGVGIAAEDRDRVFEEFVQLANPARDRAQGVGLGLAIVKRISDLLDAKVSMESSVGHGTRISFQVPLASNPQAGTSQDHPRLQQSDSFAGLRVWAVEDDPLVHDGLAAQFAAWGIQHEFATDRDGIERLREKDGAWPDAVVLDDMLGMGEQGLEIASWLSECLPRDRIVLVTGNVDPDRTLRLEQSGFAVLLKPLASQDLAQWLMGALATAESP